MRTDGVAEETLTCRSCTQHVYQNLGERIWAAPRQPCGTGSRKARFWKEGSVVSTASRLHCGPTPRLELYERFSFWV